MTLRRPAVLLVVVLLVGAGAEEAARAWGPARLPAGAVDLRTADVASTRLACPPGGQPTTGDGLVGLVPGGPTGASTATSGLVRTVPLSAPPRPAVSRPRLDVPGTAPVAAELPAGAAGLAVTATGGRAPGAAAGVVGGAGDGDSRGLLAAPCLPAAGEQWLVGPGSRVGQRGRLYLLNPEPVPAVVDVTVHGPDGPLGGAAGREVAVAAGGSRVLLLDALAPDLPRLAVHVVAREGRVAAFVRDSVVRGLTPGGVEWLPPSAPPARRVVVPAGPAGGGARLLRIVVPGGQDAIARVRLLAPDGPFVPPGGDVLAAAAGGVTELDLAEALRRGTAAVEVTADVPLTATVVAGTESGGDGGPTDLVYLPATAPVVAGTPGWLAVAPVGANRVGQVSLAAPGAATGAELLVVRVGTGATGTAAPAPVVRRYALGAGTSTVVDLGPLAAELGADPGPGGGAVAVQVRASGAGPVVAAALLARTGVAGGPLRAAVPVVAGRYTVAVPAVEGSVG